MPDLPIGTVTFLFTDIAGSTKLWEQHNDAMSTALARHDTLLREAVESHNGVIFKTVGDAGHMVFSSPFDALAAAAAAQRAVHTEPWDMAEPLRVRMAMHTGVAELRGATGDNGTQALGRLVAAPLHGQRMGEHGLGFDLQFGRLERSAFQQAPHARLGGGIVAARVVGAAEIDLDLLCQPPELHRLGVRHRLGGLHQPGRALDLAKAEVGLADDVAQPRERADL